MQVVELPSPTAYWELYRDSVYRQNLHPQQEQECKRAFLAGMEATYKMMFEVIDKGLPDEISEVAIKSYRTLIQQHAYVTHHTEAN